MVWSRVVLKTLRSDVLDGADDDPRLRSARRFVRDAEWTEESVLCHANAQHHYRDRHFPQRLLKRAAREQSQIDHLTEQLRERQNGLGLVLAAIVYAAQATEKQQAHPRWSYGCSISFNYDYPPTDSVELGGREIGRMLSKRTAFCLVGAKNCSVGDRTLSCRFDLLVGEELRHFWVRETEALRKFVRFARAELAKSRKRPVGPYRFTLSDHLGYAGGRPDASRRLDFEGRPSFSATAEVSGDSA